MAYIFLDESGDLGFNSNNKNSKFFIVTIVFINNKKLLEKIVKDSHKILRKKVKKLSGGVLHAFKEKIITRKRLLRKIAKTKSSILCIILDKSHVFTKLQNEKHILYNYIVNILLDRIFTKKLVNTNDQIILVASKRETNKFLNLNFESYLRIQAKIKHKLDLKVEIKAPSEEKALQATDFVSWAIFHKYEFSDLQYYKIIEDLIVEENKLFR